MDAENNLKDTSKSLPDSEPKPAAWYGAGTSSTSVSLSYRKTNNLITALYMVTDILDKAEPMRHKLRTLGVEILSDTLAVPAQTTRRIVEVLSLLEIAGTVNLISEMNCGILRREFLELKKAINEASTVLHGQEVGEVNLGNYFKVMEENAKRHEEDSIGHIKRTRIGVQKGSTLLKALSDRVMSDTKSIKENHELIKKQRRFEIIMAINENKE